MYVSIYNFQCMDATLINEQQNLVFHYQVIHNSVKMEPNTVYEHFVSERLHL